MLYLIQKITYLMDVCSTVFWEAASLYRLAAVKLFLPARLLIVVSTVLEGTVEDTLDDDNADERLEVCDDMAVVDVVSDVIMVAGNS